MATHPVLLPGKVYGRGVWQATVHGVAKNQTQLSTNKQGLTLIQVDLISKSTITCTKIIFPNEEPLASPLLCGMWNLPRARNQTHVPCIGRWILNHWTTRKALTSTYVALLCPRLCARLWW